MPLCLEISDNAPTKHVGYGLPCAQCRAYYEADLAACPICGCGERVPAFYQDEELRRRMAVSKVTTTVGRPQ